MKLSKQTINVLRNLAGINTNLLISPGNRLMTIAANRTMFAAVTVEETFNSKFGIYDLNELLGVLSIFNDPDMEFTDRMLTISEGKNRIRYMPANESVLSFPTKEPKFPESPDASFVLSAQHLSQIIKAASVLKVPVVTVKGDGTKIVVLVHDKTNPNSNQFIIDVEEDTDRVFDMHVKVEYLKMLHENYTVFVSFNKILKFVGENKVYVVTCELDSSSE